MALPLYLAMTEGEIANCPLPAKLAYMACHFSPYGKGLADFPQVLPEGSLLILDDRVPAWNHDPVLVAEQLDHTIRRLGCSGLLLDFQQPGNLCTAAVVKQVSTALSIPCAVSEAYAGESDGGVLISTPLPNQPLRQRTAPWEGRELWLEVAAEAVRYTVTEEGSCREIIAEHKESYTHQNDRLCCSYRVEAQPDRAIFTIGRTWENLQRLMGQAEEMGFTRAVGLYQQLGQQCI